MKKIVLVLALVSIIGAGTAFADFGIGLHGGGHYGGNVGGGGGLNLAFDSLFIYIDYVGGGSGLNLSGAVDFWQFLGGNLGAGPVLNGNFAWYWRLGIPVGLHIGDNYLGLNAGVRFPIGVSWRKDIFELFLQAVPLIGVRILPIDDIGLWWNVGGNLGFRIWF